MRSIRQADGHDRSASYCKAEQAGRVAQDIPVNHGGNDDAADCVSI